jgi:hypothetical protein
VACLPEKIDRNMNAVTVAGYIITTINYEHKKVKSLVLNADKND